MGSSLVLVTNAVLQPAATPLHGTVPTSSHRGCYIKRFCSISSLRQKRGLLHVIILQDDLIGIFSPFTVQQTSCEAKQLLQYNRKPYTET